VRRLRSHQVLNYACPFHLLSQPQSPHMGPLLACMLVKSTPKQQLV